MYASVLKTRYKKPKVTAIPFECVAGGAEEKFSTPPPTCLIFQSFLGYCNSWDQMTQDLTGAGTLWDWPLTLWDWVCLPENSRASLCPEVIPGTGFLRVNYRESLVPGGFTRGPGVFPACSKQLQLPHLIGHNQIFSRSIMGIFRDC